MRVRLVNVLMAGRLQYAQGIKLQISIRDSLREGALGDTIVVLEHDPVYTVGLRDKSYTQDQENKLRALGADFHRTSRGGLITFHGPGQLVVYPIIDLRNYKPSVRWYVSSLEETIINLCSDLGLHAYRSPHTGVWVNDKKICALGVHASRYVTTHGMALNCNTDLSWFSHIVPCGIPDKGVTSLSEELNHEITSSQVCSNFLKQFQSVFDVEYKTLTREKLQELLISAKKESQ